MVVDGSGFEIILPAMRHFSCALRISLVGNGFRKRSAGLCRLLLPRTRSGREVSGTWRLPVCWQPYSWPDVGVAVPRAGPPPRRPVAPARRAVAPAAPAAPVAPAAPAAPATRA